MDRDELLRVLQAFESEGLEYVLIGATAMGFHGLVRATEDVDLVVRATPENIDRLRRAFRTVYADDPHIDEIRAADLLGDYPSIRYYPPSGDLFFDVLTRLGEIATFDTIEGEVKEIEEIRVRVATPAALYRMKKGTIRPLDWRDAAALRGGSDCEWRTDVPVQKFHSVAEMNAVPVQTSQDRPFDRFVRHCERYRAISPRTYPRGVFRFRTIDEAQAARELVAAKLHRPGAPETTPDSPIG